MFSPSTYFLGRKRANLGRKNTCYKQNNQNIFAVEQGQDQDQDQDQAKETSTYEKSRQKIKRELNKM